MLVFPKTQAFVKVPGLQRTTSCCAAPGKRKRYATFCCMCGNMAASASASISVLNLWRSFSAVAFCAAGRALTSSVRRFKNLKRLTDEVSARPAAQKASALKDRHKFKTEMDAEALAAMFPHMQQKVA